MIFPEKEDLNETYLTNAVRRLYNEEGHELVDKLKECKTLEEWLWLLEPEYYPHDNLFCSQPDYWGPVRRIKPQHKGRHATLGQTVYYYFLPLIGHNKKEVLSEPLDARRSKSTALSILSAYTEQQKEKNRSSSKKLKTSK